MLNVFAGAPHQHSNGHGGHRRGPSQRPPPLPGPGIPPPSEYVHYRISNREKMFQLQIVYQQSKGSKKMLLSSSDDNLVSNLVLLFSFSITSLVGGGGTITATETSSMMSSEIESSICDDTEDVQSVASSR